MQLEKEVPGKTDEDGTAWHVFLNRASGTHIVLHNTLEMEGHNHVFNGNFAECMAFANRGGADRPTHATHGVFRNQSTRTLMVLWAEKKSDGLVKVYGPDTFRACVEWARNNAGNSANVSSPREKIQRKSKNRPVSPAKDVRQATDKKTKS